MIRRRAVADLPACVRVLRAVHLHSGYPYAWPADPAAWLTPEGLTGAWVAEDADGRVAGHAALCGREVSRLYVDPAARGQGLGGRLLRAVTEAAAAGGLRPVLAVHAADTAAIALYERRGWRCTGTERQDWGGRSPVTVRYYEAPVAPPRTPG
ncbi:GNAT family N-acetyltransferase [Streptomyces sp. Ru73]|uniref:GNAT family N-acetyltransferase n=1 Tax=Streptomyces sp. Ru73 TaxID=2080748 RepID=UPI000CDD33AD|nr:GNAT family N-acetyltransferase [Streptomyces sp. Ru73]POX40236.1 GNAT family N-acetyltransferase [Streptomyces sp. Ru73]